MPNIRTFKTSFVGGEVAPELYGRLDLEKEQSGLALCENFVILPSGPAQNRAGLRMVSNTKANAVARLLSFSFSNSQTFALEMGAGYFRFHTLGKTLMYLFLYPELLGDSELDTFSVPWTLGMVGTGTYSYPTPAAVVNFIKSVVTLLSPSAGNYGQISQAIATVPGTTYDFMVSGSGQFYLYAETTLHSGVAGGDLLSVLANVGGAAPVSYGYTFTATTTTTYIRLLAAPGAGSALIGAVSVRQHNAQITPYNHNSSYAAGVLAHDVFGNVYTCLSAAGAGVAPVYAPSYLWPAYNSAYWSQVEAGLPALYAAGPTYNAGDVVYSAGVMYWALATNGAVLTDPLNWHAMPVTGEYEIGNYYSADELFDVHFVQSGDVVTLTHPNHPPLELLRWSNLHWILKIISFASTLTPPATPTVVATTGYTSGWAPQPFQYKITALDAFGQQESLASTASTAVNNDLAIAASNYNSISWSAAAGAGMYNIYKSFNGMFGYIGQVPGTIFKDGNITPDFTLTPPLQESSLFFGTDNFPAATGLHEQRRFFGGTINQPNSLWGSQPAAQSNMDYSLPSQASDALRVTIAAQRANQIRHIVSLKDLIILTASTEYRVYTASGDALAPTTITIKAQSQNGANNVQPVFVDNTCVYAASQGGHIRAMSFGWQVDGYISNDLCLLATHLFKFFTIVDLAFSRSPFPIIWAVNDQGKLLGCTFLPEQQVTAWHQHVTINGFIESVCTVTEGNFDAVYVVVRRVINGATVRFVEMLDSRAYQGDLSQAFFVDCGISFSSAVGPVTMLSGLNWLEGQVVSVLADGVVQSQKTVTAGSITLDAAATTVQVGLPITADLETLPLAVAGDASLGQGRVKAVNHVWARCVDFTRCSIGPAFDALVKVPPLAVGLGGVTPKMANGEFKINPFGKFSPDGGVVFRLTDPVPLTVADVTLEVSIGG